MKITSRSVLSFALLAASSALSVTALAAKPAGCPEGYIYLETGDGNSGSTGTGFDHSSLTEESTTGHWSDHLPPTSDKDYYVSGLQLATPNNNSVAAGTVYRFGGRTLMLDAGGTIAQCSKKDSICDFGENVIIKGGQYSFPALGTYSSICSRGKATVSGTTFKFEAGSGMRSRADYCYLDWSFSGQTDAQFAFTQNNASYYTTWWWCGDCSEYYGRCVMQSSAAVTAENYSILAISNSVFNGTIEVQKYQHLQSFGDDAFIARAEIAEGATLDVASGHTTRIGTLVLNGKMNFTTRTSKLGLTEGLTFGPNAQVLLAKDIEGAIITMPSSVAFDVETFLAAVQRGNGAARTIAAKVVDNGDDTKSVVVLNPGAAANGTLTIDEDMSIAGSDAKYRVSVAEGRTLDLIDGAERMAVELKDNAMLNIRRRFEDWATIPTLWLDASAADTVTSLSIDYEDSYACYDASGTYLKQGETICYTNGYPFVRGWMDWRSTQTTVKLWNNRYDLKHPDSNGFHKSMHGTFPYLVTNGLNGKNYLSFGKRSVNYNNVQYIYSDDTTKNCNFSNMSRIFMTKFASDVTVASDCTIKPKYVIMVFGSQMGGGVGLLGDNSTTSKFVRMDGVDNPILPSDTTMTAWVDGQPISSPGTATHILNGGWQVITLGVNGNSVHGLGYSTSSGSDNGGQNYAEIIFVDQELTERQRQTIEIYLAEKWGLADKYHYPEWAKDPLATVYGTGTVKLEADATLGGAFEGTVDLNGNDLVIDGTALPPTEAAIDTTALEGWYDPDEEGATHESPVTVTYNLAAGGTTNQVKVPNPRMITLRDKIRAPKKDDLLIYGQPQRAPWLNGELRGFGPARKWMEFSNLMEPIPKGVIEKDSISNGQVLRFSKYNSALNSDGNTYQQPMQTLFMVQDSVNGGGHPFADGENVNKPVLYKSRTGTKSAVGQPIYPAGTADILTKGLTCIDGREVDGLTESFGARPEVLTVVPTNTFNVVALGQLGNSENIKGGNTEVIGEVMIYNRKLEAAERKVVEAYLSYKWLGLANEGYSDLTAATVTGVGKVTAASAALLPKFGADFTGTVSVPLADGLKFTLVTDTATTVSGALDLGGGALEIPSGTTSIDISVAKSGAKPRAGSYKLIGWTSKPAVTWNLSLDGWTRESTALRVANDGLYLDLEKVGMTVLIR